MSSEPIIFYDIPSNESINKMPWSPNTWKTRYVLNYKGLKYRTEWVEYPDIEGVSKKLGALPTKVSADGKEHYTLPLIYDPSTKKAVSDSWNIAQYLDDTYPDTPRVFPAGTHALQAAFHDFFWTTLVMPVFMTVIAKTNASLNPRSEEYFRATREAALGAKLEQLGTEEQWAKAEAAFGTLKGYLEKNGEGKDVLLSGEPGKITYSDIQVAGVLVWFRIVYGPDSAEWKRLSGWHGGKWGKYLEQFAKYEGLEN